MRYGAIYIGCDFYDHTKDVHGGNSYPLCQPALLTNFNQAVLDTEHFFELKKYAWIKAFVIDDFDGAAPTTLTLVRDRKHPLKSRVQLNAAANPKNLPPWTTRPTKKMVAVANTNIDGGNMVYTQAQIQPVDVEYEEGGPQ